MKSVFERAFFLIVAVAVSPAMGGTFTIYSIGNSFTGRLEYHTPYLIHNYESALGNTYTYGQVYQGSTSLTWFYNNPDPNLSVYTGFESGMNIAYNGGLPSPAPFNNAPWNTALPDNTWNIVTMQPFWSPGYNSSDLPTLGSDRTAVDGFISAARQNPNNSSTRFFIYACWPQVSSSPSSGDNAASEANFTAATSNTSNQKAVMTRGYYQDLYNDAKVDNPGVSLSVIPVGEVLYALTVEMDNHEFDGLTSIDQLHADPYHTNFLGDDIIAWTAYSTFFQTSPVGQPDGPSNRTDGTSGGYTDVLTSSLDAHDINLIQTTIWNVVNQYSYYTDVPEPASGAVVLGVLTLLGARRRTRRRSSMVTV